MIKALCYKAKIIRRFCFSQSSSWTTVLGYRIASKDATLFGRGRPFHKESVYRNGLLEVFARRYWKTALCSSLSWRHAARRSFGLVNTLKVESPAAVFEVYDQQRVPRKRFLVSSLSVYVKQQTCTRAHGPTINDNWETLTHSFNNKKQKRRYQSKIQNDFLGVHSTPRKRYRF